MVSIIFSKPTWTEIKMDLTKGLKGTGTRVETLPDDPPSSGVSKSFITIAVLKLKQRDMFGQFPTYMARHVFVKVVAK